MGCREGKMVRYTIQYNYNYMKTINKKKRSIQRTSIQPASNTSQYLYIDHDNTSQALFNITWQIILEIVSLYHWEIRLIFSQK